MTESFQTQESSAGASIKNNFLYLRKYVIQLEICWMWKHGLSYQKESENLVAVVYSTFSTNWNMGVGKIFPGRCQWWIFQGSPKYFCRRGPNV